MAGIKEIRTKIKSVQNTRKITKAMEMVAASKMRKAQDRMRAGRPYATKVREIAANLMQAHPDYTHPYMIERTDVRAVGIVVVSTDKGLCGRSEEHTSELQSLMRISYAVFCLKKKTSTSHTDLTTSTQTTYTHTT